MSGQGEEGRKRQKLSGYANRKRRAKVEAENASLGARLISQLSKRKPESANPDAATSLEAADNSRNHDDTDLPVLPPLSPGTPQSNMPLVC